MAILVQNVFATHQLLVYRVTATVEPHGDSDTFNIPCLGGPSPDLLTDARGGPLKTIFRARTEGLGPVPPGPLTKAHARALLFCDDPTRLFGSENVPRALTTLQPTFTEAHTWAMDAIVDENGSPILVVGLTKTGDGIAYLQIKAVHSLSAG